MIDYIWNKYDTDQSGSLELEEALKFLSDNFIN